jgi:predicted dithiol-disulfide oxidoreductase (DUF899 family)
MCIVIAARLNRSNSIGREEICLRKKHGTLYSLPFRVEKNYVFEGPDGRTSLGELFQGRSQLVVYHFMFALVAISRAPWEKLEAFRRRTGWNFSLKSMVEIGDSWQAVQVEESD